MRYRRRTNGRTSIAACWALRIFDAATICIARVICAVVPIDRIRRRMSRALAMNVRAECPPLGGRKHVLELLDRSLQLRHERIVERPLRDDRPEEVDV